MFLEQIILLCNLKLINLIIKENYVLSLDVSLYQKRE